MLVITEDSSWKYINPFGGRGVAPKQGPIMNMIVIEASNPATLKL